MKYKLNYTPYEYAQLMCEFTELEPPYVMVDLDKSLRNVNQVLSIADKNEFPKILAAKRDLENNAEWATKLIFHYIQGDYKNRILNFLNSLIVIARPSVFNPNTIYGEPVIAHIPHLRPDFNTRFNPYIEIRLNDINVLHKPALDKLGLVDNQDLFSFILLHVSQFSEFHHFDIYGKRR